MVDLGVEADVIVRQRSQSEQGRDQTRLGRVLKPAVGLEPTVFECEFTKLVLSPLSHAGVATQFAELSDRNLASTAEWFQLRDRSILERSRGTPALTTVCRSRG